MTTLVFVHGRGQHGRDPNELRRRWCAGLNSGLTLAGHSPVKPDDVIFPYYADLLHAKELEAVKEGSDFELESVRRRPSRLPIDPLMPQGISIVEGAILQSMAADVEGPTEDIDREGFADLLRLPGARRLAERLAELTDGEQEIIERFLRDVAIYLVYARRDIQRMLRTALRKVDGDLILVGHSLGSVVAHELLEDKAIRQRTVAFVTLGSPLGIQGVYKNLAKPGTHHPGTPAWLTVYDPLDFVAIGHPIKRLYGEPLDEMSVRNPRGEAHSVERYLGHQAVASWIGNHLGA